jgi:hypothetical protein
MTSIIDLEVTTKIMRGTMYVLLDDDLGRLTLRRVRPWHRLLARGLATRLDRQLADGARPEANAILAARAMFLTSAGFRRALAANLRRIVVAAMPVAPDARLSARVARQPHVPLRRDRIARSAPGLAGLAGSLAAQGPVPARGVALVSQLLADGGGPLYRTGCQDDLNAIIERASQALIR